jgi:hypothetical protein
MIVTDRDAEESMSPVRKPSTASKPKKSKKSSKKSSHRDEEKHKSKKSSKSKNVRDTLPEDEVDDTPKPPFPKEDSTESVRSFASGDGSNDIAAETPDNTSGQKIPRRPSLNNLRRLSSSGAVLSRQSSVDFNTSSSSASVMSRLANPLQPFRSKSFRSPTKEYNGRESFQSSQSSEFVDDAYGTPRRSTLDSANHSPDNHLPPKHRKGGKLISRLVSSPSQLDNSSNSDIKSASISESDRRGGTIADDDDEKALSMGIELALLSGDVPRLCDAKGRCLFHPHIRLQKPKLFGGWKILFKHCPDCAVEHMRATQDKIAENQKKKKKKKKRREKKSDPIIGKNVGDEDFTPKKTTKKKKKHDEDSQKKKAREEEQHQEVHEEEEHEEPLLALPAPEPPIEDDQTHAADSVAMIYDQYSPEPAIDDDQTRAADAGTMICDQSYAESLAIVEHRPPRNKKVNGLPWSDYNGQSGRYTGEVNEQYLPHGKGEMVYDKGFVSAGIWYNGVLDTEEPVSMDGYVPDRLPNYEIGDKGSDDDMIITSKRETAAAVAQIRVNDAAFVRRTDGSWTYAIVKDRVDDGRNQSIRFKVNTRGSTKAFPPSQWGTYIRCINRNKRSDAPAKRSAPGLGEYLDSNRRGQHVGQSHSVSGNFTGYSGDGSVNSTHSAPILDRHRSSDNLTTAKMKIRTKSRSRSRGRKNVTTLPLLFSSSMSVSEEAEDDNNDEWETASGSGYRLRGIDP